MNKNRRTLLILAVAGLPLMALPTHAATIFVTNDNGNAAALDGDGAGTITPLTLSAADGGGTINVTTIGAFNGTGAQTLGMTSVSMGVGNEKWGNTDQRWLFSFDQTVDFDALSFSDSNQGMKIESLAWKDDADTTGSNWSFTSNGTIGTFSFSTGDTTPKTFDFTSAGVSSVAAGTEIKIQHVTGAGGARMLSFTITPIPEPATLALAAIGLGGLRRRRK